VFPSVGARPLPPLYCALDPAILKYKVDPKLLDTLLKFDGSHSPVIAAPRAIAFVVVDSRELKGIMESVTCTVHSMTVRR
jgi:hypothetical protein